MERKGKRSRNTQNTLKIRKFGISRIEDVCLEAQYIIDIEKSPDFDVRFYRTLCRVYSPRISFIPK